MKAATLFSGIGAPEVAMPHWQWLWHAEIEKFPCAVMKARHPESVNLGDVNAEDFVERAKKYGPIDVIVAGPPCQAWSVAGQRRGFEDPRGNIMFRFLEIVDQIKPEFIVFENVPGLLSEGEGQSFETILCKFNEIGYSIEGDIIDAQHFGVPQRRRRIFLLCANVDAGRKRRSPFFAAATGQFLTDCLLSVLVAAGGLFQANDCALASAKYSASSLQRRMQLFGLWSSSSKTKSITSTSIRSFRSLLSDWEEALKPSQTTPKSLASLSENSRRAADTPGEKLSGGAAKNTAACQFTSMSPIWSSIWDVVCGAAKSCTTSTSTRRTTSQQIFSCAEAALSIVDFTVNSNGSVANLFDEGSSGLTALRGFTNYARWADSDLFSALDGVHDWYGFARRAETTILEAERHLGDRAHSGEVFPIPESMCRDIATGREAREDVAGTVTARVGNGSRQAGANGNLAGQTEFLPQSSRVYDEEGVGPTLQATGKRNGQRTPMIAASTSGDGYWREGIGPLRGRDQDSHENLVAGTLEATSGKSRGAGTPPGMLMPMPMPIQESGKRTGKSSKSKRAGDGLGEPGDPMFTIGADSRHAVAYGGNNTSGAIEAATAVRAKGGTGHGDFESETFVVADPITASYQKHGGASAGKDSTPRNLVVQTCGSNVGVEDDLSGTLGQNADRASGSAPMVLAFDTTQITHPENRSRPDDRSPQFSQSGHPPAVAFSQRTRGDDGRGYEREHHFTEEVSPTVDAVKPPGVIAFDCKAGGDTSFAVGDQAGSLRGEGHGGGHAAVFKPSHYTRGKDSGPSGPSDVMAPLTADADKGDQDPILFTGAAVRRLTPVECARLQNFPDDYLDIKFRGKPAADGPKYRALGNSMCVAEIRWILRRIEMFEGLKK